MNASEEETAAGITAFLTRGGMYDTTASIRDINYIKTVSLVHSVRSISRTEIASRLNLSKTTVSAVVRRMLADNVVHEVGKGDSNGGRKPRLLEFNRKIKVSVGIVIGDRECIGVLTDVYAHPIESPVVLPIKDDFTPGGWKGRMEILHTIREITADLDPANVLGIGIGIPGIYDENRHVITVAESLGLENFSTHMLEEEIGFPVRVINRANAAALGEKRYGLGQKIENLIFVSIGAGVGAGIIIKDKLLMGSTGSAGEIGHTVVLPHGPLCRCGSSGCLESLVSSNLLLSSARELCRREPDSLLGKLTEGDPERIDLNLILQAAREGDERLHRVLDQQGEYIGIALANAVNLFDPQLIVIGGEMGILLGEFLLTSIRSMVRSHARYFSSVEVAVSGLGMLAAPVGASACLLT